MMINYDHYNPYEDLNAISKAQRIPIQSMTVLAEDPFEAGSPLDIKYAEWFAEQWNEYGPHSTRAKRAYHIRSLHYALLSMGVLLPERPQANNSGCAYGQPGYHIPKHNRAANEDEAIDASWSFINTASRLARWLGLVDVDEMEDKRNTVLPYTPKVRTGAAPTPVLEGGFNLAAAGIGFAPFHLGLAPTEVTGYEYDLADQPRNVAIWIEKSTMDEELLPICERLGSEYVTGTGYQSITRIREALLRAINDPAGRKVIHIGYISDADTAGDAMPVQVARHIEFWLKYSGLAGQIDVTITPLAINLEQAAEWGIPTIASKAGGRAVELDALPYFAPGKLEEIVTDFILQHRDVNLEVALTSAEQEAQRIAAEADQVFRAVHLQQIHQIQAHADLLSDDYIALVDAASVGLATSLARVMAQATALGTAHAQVLQANTLPARPTVNEDNLSDIDPDVLFDSTRSFMEQVEVFKGYQGHDMDQQQNRVQCQYVPCGKWFTALKSTAKYCPGTDCRQKYNRAAKKAS